MYHIKKEKSLLLKIYIKRLFKDFKIFMNFCYYIVQFDKNYFIYFQENFNNIK